MRTALKTLVLSQTPTHLKLRLLPAQWPANAEARQTAMREATRQVIAERGLNPLREPHLTPAANGFTCELDLFPAVELPALTVSCEIPKLEVPGEQALQLALEGLQIQLGEAESVQGPADWGQLLIVDMAGFCQKQPIPMSFQVRVPMLLKKDAPDAEFLAGLIGMLPGEKRVLPHTLAQDFKLPAWRGAKAEYHLYLHELRQLKVPPADDQLARACGAGERLDDLLAVLFEQLRQQARAAWRDRLREAVVAKVVDQSKLQLPASLLDEQLKASWQVSDAAMIKQLAKGLALPAQIEAASWQSWQAHSWLKQIQARNLKTQLVLREIGLKQGIDLDSKELLRPLEVLGSMRSDGNLSASWQNLAESGEFPAYANQVWLDKVVRWLISQARLTQDGKPFKLPQEQ
ncbi:MAG: hypothetical protein CVV27_05420 [Candidatus Melainabacteria bacterium HGW-Melainabacteria-1]|nr:MAG: hypothetical protein CVV27_05420 [Candidatus Melainabacteria bacterium HGW-Melainabacteria-1]